MNSRLIALLGSLSLVAVTTAIADPATEEILRQSPRLDAPGPGYTRPATFANASPSSKESPSPSSSISSRPRATL